MMSVVLALGVGVARVSDNSTKSITNYKNDYICSMATKDFGKVGVITLPSEMKQKKRLNVKRLY